LNAHRFLNQGNEVVVVAEVVVLEKAKESNKNQITFRFKKNVRTFSA
jgi:hypothetical protein